MKREGGCFVETFDVLLINTADSKFFCFSSEAPNLGHKTEKKIQPGAVTRGVERAILLAGRHDGTEHRRGGQGRAVLQQRLKNAGAAILVACRHGSSRRAHTMRPGCKQEEEVLHHKSETALSMLQ